MSAIGDSPNSPGLTAQVSIESQVRHAVTHAREGKEGYLAYLRQMMQNGELPDDFDLDGGEETEGGSEFETEYDS